MRIALAANGRMGLGLLRALQASEHDVVALVRDGRTLAGPMGWLDAAAGVAGGPWTVEGRALGAAIPWVTLNRQDEREAARLATRQVDLLLVGNFGLILKAPILAVPRLGVVNTHWSLLPEHRGPNPATSVLLTGEARTGVTFHVVDERIDAGPILAQHAFDIGPRDTATRLYVRACEEAERTVVDLVDRLAVEGLTASPHALPPGSYHRKLTVEQVVLDFQRPALDLDRLVRAVVQPMPRFVWQGQTIYVSAARPVDGEGEPGTVLRRTPAPVVACGEGALLLERCWTARPPMPWPAPWSRVVDGTRLG